MNCIIREEEQVYTFLEPTTSLTKAPNFILDEWATTYPIQEVKETSLGTHCIFEEGVPIPNLMKAKSFCCCI